MLALSSAAPTHGRGSVLSTRPRLPGRLSGAAVALAVGAVLNGALPGAQAAALPDCPQAVAPHVLLKGQGLLESIAFDGQGRLLYTDISQGALKRLDQAGAAPALAAAVSSPGGIVVAGEHTAFVGTGNGAGGLLPSLGKAGIVQVDLDSGTVQSYVKGLSMSNGVVRASDGTFYASDDLAASLDRVLPDGTVQRGWLKQASNGMAFSADEATLYVNQSLPSKVLAIDRASGAVRVYAEPPSSVQWMVIDGMTIDRAGRLYVAANFGGQVWRVDPSGPNSQRGDICVLARGMAFPSAVAIGSGVRGFNADSLYVTTFGGSIVELPGVLAPNP